MTDSSQEKPSTVVIKNLDIYYPSLLNPKSPFGTEQWELMVATKDEETIRKLEDVGAKLRDFEGMKATNLKRTVMSSKGVRRDPPKVLDSEGQKMTDETVLKLGNGSRGHVKLFCYSYSVAGRKGKSSMLLEVKVTDYKEYTGASDSEDF